MVLGGKRRNKQSRAQAEILAVGSELLLGGRQETNSLFITEALASVGIEVRFKAAVGDEAGDIAQALRTACRRSEVVIMTGGLGPTSDDRTRKAVALATGRPLRRNSDALEGMRHRLAQWGRKPNPQQLRQTFIPAGAQVLQNSLGSAPGFFLRWNGCALFALPGVPSEAKEMLQVEVLPRLSDGSARRKGPIVRRTINTFGLNESEVETRLKGLFPSGSGVRLGLLASPLGVVVSLTSKERQSVRSRPAEGRSHGECERLVLKIRTRLGSCVFGEGTETMEEVVGRVLSARKLTLAIAESCTGGLIGHRLTQVPGSSDYLDRGVICYSNRSKQELLGVSESLISRHGAVSPHVAAAMAKGVRERSQADVGLSVTGIAGPGGGTDRKPVGLVYVGLDAGAKPTLRLTWEFRYHGDRHMIKLRASQAALNVLRLSCLDPRSLVAQ